MVITSGAKLVSLEKLQWNKCVIAYQAGQPTNCGGRQGNQWTSKPELKTHSKKFLSKASSCTGVFLVNVLSKITFGFFFSSYKREKGKILQHNVTA